jgi:hypothetical protein
MWSSARVAEIWQRRRILNDAWSLTIAWTRRGRSAVWFAPPRRIRFDSGVLEKGLLGSSPVGWLKSATPVHDVCSRQSQAHGDGVVLLRPLPLQLFSSFLICVVHATSSGAGVLTPLSLVDLHGIRRASDRAVCRRLRARRGPPARGLEA